MEIIHGDSLLILPGLRSGSFAAVVTDPPYSSGGAFRSDRSRPTSKKYTLTGTARVFPDFDGDSRDQRGMLVWASLWLAECLRLTEPGGPLLMFSDWRQLPLFTDAVQAAGWTWRGIVPWDKTEGTRPQKGWFRAQCEYVITASKGAMPQEQLRAGDCLPGCFRQNVLSHEKLHAAGKPRPLMQQLLRVVRPGGRVLDPFTGSGTTLLAAQQSGVRATGIESVAEIAATAAARCGATLTGGAN